MEKKLTPATLKALHPELFWQVYRMGFNEASKDPALRERLAREYIERAGASALSAEASLLAPAEGQSVQAAIALGGQRNSRGVDVGTSEPDVTHALFSVEVKYRKQLPRLLWLGLDQAAQYHLCKPPLLVVKERYQRGALVVLRLGDFVDLLGPLIEPARAESESTHDEHEQVSTIGL